MRALILVVSADKKDTSSTSGKRNMKGRECWISCVFYLAKVGGAGCRTPLFSRLLDPSMRLFVCVFDVFAIIHVEKSEDFLCMCICTTKSQQHHRNAFRIASQPTYQMACVEFHLAKVQCVNLGR